jgi:hypothetical protein
MSQTCQTSNTTSLELNLGHTSSYSTCIPNFPSLLPHTPVATAYKSLYPNIHGENLVLWKPIYNKSSLVLIFASIFFRQLVNPFMLQCCFSCRKLNQIPSLVIYQGIHFLFHAFLPLLFSVYLNCLFIKFCFTRISQQ